MAISDFDLMLSLLNDDDFTNLTSFKWQAIDDLRSYRQVKKKESVIADKKGIYVISSKQGEILYIGKAKCLHSRICSHSKAMIGADEERAPAWDQFFRYYENSKLKVQYAFINGFSDEKSEHVRQALERALQVKHRPFFDTIYSKNKNRVHDIEAEVEKCRAITTKP
jgi:hypothetical protein